MSIIKKDQKMLDELIFLSSIREFYHDFFAYVGRSYIDMRSGGIDIFIMMNGFVIIKSIDGNILVKYNEDENSYMVLMFDITSVVTIPDLKDIIEENSEIDEVEYTLRYGRLPSFYIKNLRENISEFTSKLKSFRGEYGI